MTVQLKINKTIFYLNALLFVSMSLVFVIGLYFSNNLDSYIVFIGSGMACFILPWSFFSAMSEWDKNQKQFQTLKIEDDFLLFENLPLQGGSTQFVQIDFKNIEKIQVFPDGKWEYVDTERRQSTILHAYEITDPCELATSCIS